MVYWVLYAGAGLPAGGGASRDCSVIRTIKGWCVWLRWYNGDRPANLLLALMKGFRDASAMPYR